MIHFVESAYAELTTAILESGGAKVFTQRAFEPVGLWYCNKLEFIHDRRRQCADAMASSCMIPHIFAKTHPKYKTPHLAIILIGVLSIISLFWTRDVGVER